CVAAKALHPQRMGENHHALAASLAVGGAEATAPERCDTHGLEELGRDTGAADLRLIAAAGERHARPEVRRQVLERLARAGPLLGVPGGAEHHAEAPAR